MNYYLFYQCLSSSQVKTQINCLIYSSTPIIIIMNPLELIVGCIPRQVVSIRYFFKDRNIFSKYFFAIFDKSLFFFRGNPGSDSHGDFLFVPREIPDIEIMPNMNGSWSTPITFTIILTHWLSIKIKIWKKDLAICFINSKSG